jgi:hypothetical protein
MLKFQIIGASFFVLFTMQAVIVMIRSSGLRWTRLGPERTVLSTNRCANLGACLHTQNSECPRLYANSINIFTKSAVAQNNLNAHITQRVRAAYAQAYEQHSCIAR